MSAFSSSILVALPLALFVSSAAYAQGDAPGAGATDVSKAEPKPGPAETEIGPIERLPPSAFPAPTPRGIHGGSLWSTFHGLQWPYYPKTGIGISGYAWIDTGYEEIRRGNPTEQGIKYRLQQGRLLLRVTPTYTFGDFFVQAQAELVANKDQSQAQPNTADTDDLWVRVGQWKTWDLQLGRFENWEVYHLGMGLDLHTLERQGAVDEAFAVPDIYGLSYAYYRPAGVGRAAAHLYPTDWFRVELATEFGNEFGSNVIAGRPVGILDFGFIRVKAGVEYKKLTDQKEGSKGETTQRGSAGSVHFVFDPYIEFGVNGSYGIVDRVAQDGTVDEKGTNEVYSFGGFANVRIIEDLLFGAGANITKLEDIHLDRSVGDVDHFSHLQAFGALQYLVMKQLFVKFVGAYARSEFHPVFGEPIFNNTMVSGRLRLLYLF
jgi:hypothetical protein